MSNDEGLFIYFGYTFVVILVTGRVMMSRLADERCQENVEKTYSSGGDRKVGTELKHCK